jgi:hypothetical protein
MSKGGHKFSDYSVYKRKCFHKFNIPLKFLKIELKIELKID